MSSPSASTPERRDAVLSDLTDLVAEALEIERDTVDMDMHFEELGADSLLLLDVRGILQRRYGVNVAMKQIFTEAKHLRGLAELIAARPEAQIALAPPPGPAPAEVAAPRTLAAPTAQPKTTATARPSASATPVATPDARAADGHPLEAIVAQQLDAFERLSRSQLAALSGADADASSPPARARVEAPATAAIPEQTAAPTASVAPKAVTSTPVAPPVSLPDDPESGRRREAFLDTFQTRYNRRTASSKALAQDFRRVSADIRVARNFRLQTKELVYPIAARRSAGARIWDVDDNEYVDLTMGMGTLLFGHNAPFIVEAIQEQVGRGICIGPQNERVGRVARQIAELTGNERVSFTVTGSEAVMVALRVARARTGRSKIALFRGAYHGHYDASLVLPADGKTMGKAAPAVRGVPSGVADDILILEYGDPRGLDLIRAEADALAGVLVEPVQSRLPSLVPVDFVRDLRALTRDLGVPLIFDEVLTGFRVHQGGAAALYGVEPDLATYGKVLGGGLPIGVVAGSADFLDVLDGGFWEFGDDSFPTTEMTFAGGTYNKHPLSMAVAEAVLERLAHEGPGFQEALNDRTAELARRVNDVLEASRAPIHVEHYGSLFRFMSSQKSDLFFYSMLERGIYIWEQRICFLSEAHAPEDLDLVVDAVERSVDELGKAGFLPRPHRASVPTETPSGDLEPLRVPLTEIQRQIFFLSVLDENAAPAYHEAALLRITGAFDLDCARRAAARLIQRHQGLRAAIEPEGTHQTIRARAQIEIPITDLSDRPFMEREAALRECLEADAARPFELREPPPLRMRVVRLSPNEHLLFVVFHGILVDGISLGVIVAELASLYATLRAGGEPSLPEPLQLADYVEWLTARSQSDEYAEAERYWLDRLGGCEAGCPLPADRHAVGPPRYAGGREHVWLAPDLHARLRSLASGHHATLFTTLVAGFCVLLHRITGEEELLLGVRVAVRDLEGADSLIANTTNLVPISSSSHGDPTFDRFLETVRDACFDGFEHQIVPFPTLVRKLNPRRELGRQPFGNVVINMDRSRSLVLPPGVGPSVHLIDYPIARGCLDLDVNVTEVDGSVRIDFEYNADLFERESVGRWLDGLVRVLGAVAEHPDRSLSALPVLPPAEEEVLLAGAACDVPAAPPQDPVMRFLEHAALSPEAPAVSHGGTTLSYADLAGRAAALSARLRAQGVGPEVLVGLEMKRSPDLLTALLGVLMAGAAFVPLDPEWPEERTSHALETAGIRVVVGESTRPVRSGVATLHVEPDAGGGEATADSLPGARPESLAYVIYTSGSTGRPNAALLQRDGLANHLAAKIEDLGLTRDDVVAQTAPQTFDISIWQFLAPLLVGGRVHVVDDDVVRDPHALVEALDGAGVTVLETVPSLLRLLVEELPRDAKSLRRLRWLIATGEDLPADLARAWLDRRPEAALMNAYGPTECSDDVTHHVIREPLAPEVVRVPIGRPIRGLRAWVLDAAGAPAPVGTPGELCIGGVGVGRGYLDDAGRTERAFQRPRGGVPARLYRTGDRARWRRDETLEFLGRADDQVKVRGFRVELAEIATTLRRHPGVRDAVAGMVWDGRLQPQLVAWVECEGAAPPDAAELRGLARGWLPEPLVPAFFVLVERIPLTANGKVDRRALPAPKHESLQRAQEWVAARSAMEAKVAAAWEEVLRVEGVGVHDNFFELGGDSIQSIQIVNRLRAQGVSIRPSLLFLHQTVAALAAALEEADPALSAEREESPRHDFSIERMGAGELDTLASLLRDADSDDGLDAGNEAEEVASS